jgi:hypothetical protein
MTVLEVVAVAVAATAVAAAEAEAAAKSEATDCTEYNTSDFHLPGGPREKSSLVSALEKYRDDDPLSVTIRTPSLNT